MKLKKYRGAHGRIFFHPYLLPVLYSFMQKCKLSIGAEGIKNIVRYRIMVISFIGVIAVMTCLALGFWHVREINEQIAAQFNNEQLIIARSVSSRIEREIAYVKKELILLEKNISVSRNKTYEHNIIQDSFNRVLENGAWMIEIA